ncbi:MAG: type III-B CRISPR-associated protein Cas10/Cmr2 [Calothrix sp. CSU_2_0]|nr:type III-B CRISPR-associated protein Cas10/Cmr2 [Calothrix sp. CSU_2_0]
MQNSLKPLEIGLAWCLFCEAVGYDAAQIQQVRQMLLAEKDISKNNIPNAIRPYLKQVGELGDLGFPETLQTLKAYQEKYPQFWRSHIGLVYGGVTKVKQYVFTQSKLPDIRGASALLDRINLVDLKAFFNEYDEVSKYNKDYSKSITISQWLGKNFPNLEAALIPQLIIYSTGGNVLAFCPAKFVDDLANAIEKRYTEETLTANSCAVGAKFKLIETRFGLLPDNVGENDFWLEKYQANQTNEILQAYFAQADEESTEKLFQQRKSFNETVTKLASLFNKRRGGNIITENRHTRRYPVMLETHPYLVRDESDNASAVMIVGELHQEPKLSESLARKRLVGNIAKRDRASKDWYQSRGFSWQPGDAIDIKYIKSWVAKFEHFLETNKLTDSYYQKPHQDRKSVSEALSLIEIGNASQPKGFVGYIYADGNNMGGYIQKIRSAQEYQNFSEDVSEATEKCVYRALFKHLRPHQLKDIPDKDKEKRNDEWIHPFEIITIGGDDVFLIVPGDKALAISQTLCEEFENILKAEGEKRKNVDNKNPYIRDDVCNPQVVHRYHLPEVENPIKNQAQNQSNGNNQCKLSMSGGVLITAEDTPIYYAEKLTSQLMKSSKKYAKELKKKKYYGGTVDFLVMKSVTMISSNIGEYRSQGLTQSGAGQHTLKLYGAPYTLHELGGLLETAKVLKAANFPCSQLYQIRSLLERGKQTTMLNYRYFRVRLSDINAQKLLKSQFEEAWCKPKDNGNKGNLAPWMSLQEEGKEGTIYETIWRDLVDLYPFIEEPHTEFISDNEEKGNQNLKSKIV